MKLLKLCVAAVSLLLISCGSFGEGMLAAFAGYNPYGYSSYNYDPSGGNMNYLLDPNYAAAQTTAEGSYLLAGSSSSSSYSSSSSSGSSGSSSYSSSRSNDCPSLSANNGKWYCGNTGKCGMCNGDGLMDGSYGSGPNSLKCTLCNGTGKCKYCH